jgi:GxxExxY protein
MLDRDKLNELSKEIFESALSVHREMGPGLLESVYQECLLKEFKLRNINAEQMVMIPLVYKGTELSKTYVIDILVESEIIIELKALEEILPVHEAQLISYLKLANKRLGFLINFNVPLLKNGFRRFVNNF